MNANDLTFGIEIETIAPDSAVRNDGLRIGSYQHGIQVPYLPDGWKAERDGSIHNGHGGHQCEIVSPVLQGAEGLAPGRRGPQDAGGQGPPGQRLLRGPRPHRLEAGLAQRGPGPAGHHRGLPGEGPLRDHRHQEPRAGHVLRRRPQVRQRARTPSRNLDRNRYHALNLTNLARGTKDTVEFRVFSGSLNATKVVGWIQVCLGLVERALSAQADAELVPEAPYGRLEEGGRGRERGRAADGLPGLGQGLRPASTAAGSSAGSPTPSRRTRSRPSSAAWPRSTTPRPEAETPPRRRGGMGARRLTRQPQHTERNDDTHDQDPTSERRTRHA